MNIPPSDTSAIPRESGEAVKKIRILMLEDSPADAELIERELTRGNIPHRLLRVDTEEAFLKGLREYAPDLIFTDYRLPSFNGLEALALASRELPDTPCIFISGVMGEEAAIETLKEGATDYVLKHRLCTLVPAVNRALEQAKEKQARRQAQKALRKNQKLLAEAERIAHLGSWECSSEGNLTVSEEVPRIFGFETDGFRPAIESLYESLYRPDRQDVKRQIESLRADPSATDWQCRIVNQEGQIRVLHVRGRATIAPEDGRPGMIGTIQDITEMKEAEDARRRHALIVETVFDAVFVTNTDGHITDWNSAAERIFGYTRQEALGRPVAVLFRPKQAAARIREMVARSAHGECCAGEAHFLRRDGTSGACDLILEPLTDRNGQALGIMGVGRDISERRHLEQLLFRSQKIEALSLLAREAAQNFNSFLTVIMGLGELLLNSLEAGDPRRAWAAEIVSASRRSSELTGQLLTFGQRHHLETRPVDLNALLTSTGSLLRDVVGEAIHVVTVPGSRLWLVRADPAQLEQLLMNLVINARDAMPKGGVLIIQTANEKLTEEFSRRNHDVKPGNYVALAVSDTGEGMDSETQAQAFDPFFTTKDTGTSAGLGLSVVYGIVKQHRGHIMIDSRVEHGTTVTVYFPRAESQVG